MSETTLPYTLIVHPNECIIDRDLKCVRGGEHATTRHGSEEQRPYDQGGYIPGSPVPTSIHPDECLISFDDVKAGRIRCSRVGHPTATSDCARTDAQHR